MSKVCAATFAALATACGGGGGASTPTTTTTPSASPVAPAATEPPTETEPAAREPRRKHFKSLVPDELQWVAVDATAGDKGPMVVALWGDPASGPNGLFLRSPAGNKGAFHTHTNDYHGVALTPLAAQQDGGRLHDVAAGSYWFQPGGLPHLHACPGSAPCIGLRHYNTGKFDVVAAKPTKATAPDPRTDEKTLAAATWLPFDAQEPGRGAFSPIWGDMRAGENGMFVKLPAGNAPFWHIHRADYHAVVLQGTLDHHESGSEGRELPPGSYYFQPGGYKHVDLCKGPDDCIVYRYHVGAFDLLPQ